MFLWLEKLLKQENNVLEKSSLNTPQTKDTVIALWRLQKIILDTLDLNQVVTRVVDGLLTELGYLNLGYRIIVLTLVDNEKKVLKRISLSHTQEAARALAASAIPFHEIDIPLSASDNLLIKALIDQQSYVTHDWLDIFRPVLSAEEALRNQNAAGIKSSMLYPVVVKGTAIGVLIFSLIKDEKEVSEEEKELIKGFTDIVGLAVQNAQLYSNLEQAKENLEKANQRLIALDKLKDEFVSLASHELRTPMTAVRSYISMTLDEKSGSLTEKQRLYLERAHTSADRLINLVNDMLDVSRIDAGRMNLSLHPLLLDKLAEDVINELIPRAEELGVSLRLERTASLPSVMGDTDKLKQVLINLVGNSLKFTPQGGTITISFTSKDTMLETHIADTGAGIAAEDIQKLFQKFDMIESAYDPNVQFKGTGLGLYISKAIIELQKGRIWVESAGKGQGATFSFTLPILSDKQTEPATSPLIVPAG